MSEVGKQADAATERESARECELREVLQKLLLYPRWCSVGSINNQAELRVDRALYERAKELAYGD